MSKNGEKAQRDFQRQVDAWLSGREGPLTLVKRRLKSTWYNLTWPNGVRRSRWHVASYLLKAAAPAAVPLGQHFIIGNIARAPALYMAAALASLAMLGNWVERKVSAPKVKDAFPKEMLRRFGEITDGLQPEATPPEQKEQAKRACLTLMELYIRAQFGLPEGSVGVSLVVYTGASTTRLRVDARDLGSKRVNKPFDGKFVLGHRACQAGRSPRAVPDLKEFNRLARRSPTGSTVSYRSFLLIPFGEELNDIFRAKGYISIDTARPYVFYRNNADVVAVDCEMLINHLKTLV